MDADTSHNAFSAPIDVNASKPETDSDSIDISKEDSSGGDVIRELESTGAILTRLELDIACVCEKLVNLNILVMHVETRESDVEAFVSETDHNLRDLSQKALEFDLLSGILDSEVRELESFISTLQFDIVNVREVLSSYKHLGEALMDIEDKLYDSEKSLEQSLEQVSEIKDQSANFQKLLLIFSEEENLNEKKDTDFIENGDLPDPRDKIKMQTAEQQRHILRMLEKSLARELDLEKKANDSMQIEEDLKLRLHSSEQEVLYVEEEAEVVLEKFFEADYASEVLLGISKELLGHLRMLEFKLNCSVQREGELNSKIQETIAQLQSKESALKLECSNREINLSRIKEVNDKLAGAESQTVILKDKVNLLEKQLKESELQLLNSKAFEDVILEKENMINELEEKISGAEGRAKDAEAKHAEVSDRVVSLEKQLSETKIQLQHAEASADASQEKQTMLYSAIKDMENVIEDLKSKVLKAENQTESAEEKCIFLSESNSDLSEELSFLRGRVDCLEVSLHQAEETKKATAKDISRRTKLITDLIMQMALERERLQKQMSSLKHENKMLLLKCLNKADSDPAVKTSHVEKGYTIDSQLSELDITTQAVTKESKEEVVEFSSTSFEPGHIRGGSIIEPADSVSDLEIVRNIGPMGFNFRYILMGVLIMIPVLGALLLQHHSSQD